MVFLVYESVFPLSHVICPQIHIFKHFIKYPARNHPLYALSNQAPVLRKRKLDSRHLISFSSEAGVSRSPRTPPCGSVLCRQPLRGGCRVPASPMPRPFTSTDLAAKCSALKRE